MRRDASILVSDDSSTCMASLDVGNWILRGTRTVDTAGTLVAIGLLRDSSGLLLDRLVELGSSGGVNPDILTKDATFLQAAATSPRELCSASRGSANDKDDLLRHNANNQPRLRYDGYLFTKCKRVNSG